MIDPATDTGGPNVAAKRRRSLLNRWMLVGVGAVSLYALFGFLLAPWLFKRYVSNFAVEKLKRQTQRINLLLGVSASDDQTAPGFPDIGMFLLLFQYIINPYTISGCFGTFIINRFCFLFKALPNHDALWY